MPATLSPVSFPQPASGWLRLPDSGVIRATGADARGFLQNQLSNDVARLSPAQGQLTGYCSVKGRLLAVFVACMPDAETFYLSLPAALLAPTLKRLKMYVLRSKVVLEDASADLPALGLMGAAAIAELERLQLPVPLQAYATASQAGITVQRLAGELPRFLLRGAAETIAALAARMELPGLATAAWHLAEVLAAVPAVLPETVDHFVPQTVDLDLAGGVSFTKGCYPGQEIVARVHYLGRLKSRLHRATAATPPAPGTAVYAADGDGQALGAVVSAAPQPDGPALVLLTLHLSHTGSDRLRLGTVDGPALTPPALAHPT